MASKEPLRDFQEQADVNPYAGIRQTFGGGIESVPTEALENEDNPYLQFSVLQQDPGLVREDPIDPAGARFGRGVGRMALYPVRAFYEPEILQDEEPGIAGTLGELVGAGVSFIPLYRGASAVLGGVGLLKTANVLGASTRYLAPMGRSVASVRGAQAVVGATAFAGFETFAGESIEEAPFRLARGLAEGFVFEAAAMKVASSWRNRVKWRPTDPVLAPSLSPSPVESTVRVHPLALKLENMMSATLGDGPALAMDKVRSIGLPQVQLHEAFLGVWKRHMPGGQAIIPGMTQKEIVQLYKTAEGVGTGQFRLTPFRRIKGEDLFDVLVVDTKTRRTFPNRAGGQDITDYYNYLKEEFPDIVLETPARIDGDPYIYGRYIPKSIMDDTEQIQVATDNELFRIGDGISTFVHEVTHHLEWLRTSRNTGLSKANVTVNIKTGEDWRTQISLENLFTWVQGNVARISGRKLTVTEEAIRNARPEMIRKQLQEATIEVLARKRMLTRRISYQQALKAARETVEEDAKSKVGGIFGGRYFNLDAELISRMAELILLDPKKAKEIAPHASRLIGKMIADESPKLRSLMSEHGKSAFDLFTDRWRIFETEGVQRAATFWTTPPFVGSSAQKQFGKEGWFERMRVLLDGQEWELYKRTKDGKATIKNLTTGAHDVVDMARLQRPLLPFMATKDARVFKAIDEMLESVPEFMPVNLRTVFENEQGTADAVRRALVDIREFAVIDGDVKTWFRNLPLELQETLIKKHGQLVTKELGDITKQKEFEILKEALELQGKKGMVRRDNGSFEIFVPDESSIIMGNVIETTRFGQHIAGATNSVVLRPSTDDWLRHALREAGVNESDLEYYFKTSYERLGQKINKLADAEARQVSANVRAVERTIEPLGDPPPFEDAAESVAARAGLEVQRLHSGELEVRDVRSKSVLARLSDEDHLDDYLAEVTVDNSGPPLGDFPGGFHGNNGGGGALPPKPQSQPIPPPAPVEKGKLVGLENIFGSMFTALENFAKNAENKGLGPVYTKIYVPAHNAMLEVQRELAVVKRDALGGVAFGDKLGELSHALVKVPKRRYPVVTGYIEAVTRDEIERAGGLMERAMSAGELKAARFIEGVGLGNDIPRLMSTNKLIKRALGGELKHEVARMKQIQLSPESEQLLRMFESLPEFKTADEIMDFLQLTNEERQVIKIIEDSFKANKDEFSIYAVSRWASAPKLRKGFKNGRDQFAYDNKLTDKEKLVARFAQEALEAGFLDSGLDPKRHLTGYWPHIRMWTKEGHADVREFLPPDVLEWVSMRYRSGELNVYNTDPLTTVYRHLRGLYMKRHFDPIMKDINRIRNDGSIKDQRVHDVMSEYISELMGKPHTSFDALQGYFDDVFKRLLGRPAPERLSNDLISGLSAVASAAVLPFRPALIARNFFESLLKVAPRTGVSHYMRGLKYVVGNETRREAFLAAMDAGAIRPGVQKLRSLHAAEELFGPNAPQAVHRYLQIFDKGFEWYQSADDWGRAIAFHAQRFRMLDHIDDLNRGRITMRQFRERSKISTYDPLDIEIAEQYLVEGRFDAAVNHLGQVLSRETMTRYGYADHPVGWNSVTGRLFGQFGTWPVQFKDYLIQGATRGTTTDRVEFAMIHGAVSGGIVGAGAAAGLNLSNWTGWGFYTGGPYAEMAIDVTKALSGSDLEKRLARMNLYAQVPVLGWMETGNPRSIFLPGSYLLGDLAKAREALADGKIYEGLMSGTGTRVMRPNEKSPLDFIYDIF